jgi:hypothetical protein
MMDLRESRCMQVVIIGPKHAFCAAPTGFAGCSDRTENSVGEYEKTAENKLQGLIFFLATND